jgi:RNA polymerase sigma factor (sigma-70 family)
MPYRSDKELFEAVAAGDDRAFEVAYRRFQERARLMAWVLSRRADWIDDVLNEAWCRAFRLRRSYDPGTSFPIWLAGIIRNVYREHCRASPTTAEADPDVGGGIDRQTPEQIAGRAELLAALEACIRRLDEIDAAIVRLRFFDGQSLRHVAQEVRVPEATLRDVRLPQIYRTLQRCLSEKGIQISEVFPAQERAESQ